MVGTLAGRHCVGSVTRERWAVCGWLSNYTILQIYHVHHTHLSNPLGKRVGLALFSLPTMAHSTLVLASWTLLGGQINSSVLLSFTSFIFPTHLRSHSQYQSPWSLVDFLHLKERMKTAMVKTWMSQCLSPTLGLWMNPLWKVIFDRTITRTS